MHRLPGQIFAVMAGAIAIFLLTIAFSALWLARAMDEQAREGSVRLVRHAVMGVMGRARVVNLDYAKWPDALDEVAARDLDWLHANIGTSAAMGEATVLAVLWGGPFERDVGWSDDGVAAPRSGLLDPRILDQADARLEAVPLSTYQGTTFIAWRGGDLLVIAAARMEEVTGAAAGGAAGAASEDDRVRLAMGLRVDAALLRQMGESTLLTGLGIGPGAGPGHLSLPLRGGDDEPVAHLHWTPPAPGTALLWRGLPLLALVTVLATKLVLAGTWLARRSARRLVAAERLASLSARADGLTGLPNRLAFNEALAQPARAGERAVLFLDLNGFKRINDSIGHAAGDQVIALTADRLRGLAGDESLLARIGGDEFVFVLTGPGAEERALHLTEAVEAALRPPFEVQGHGLSLRAAMGYAAQQADQAEGHDLVRQADLAMYEAKRRQRGAVAFGAMIERADHDARALDRALRVALSRPGELSVEYQPIVDLATGRMARAEALARWTAPGIGPVPPDRFVAVAEQSGLVVELGRQIFGLVCDDLEAHPGLDINLNVSPLQLMSPAFVPDLDRELRRRGLDPGRIEIELTERVVVDDSALAVERIEELHQAGLSIALDDFGTGYSSIGYLQDMRFDAIKIDRTFVSGLSVQGLSVQGQPLSRPELPGQGRPDQGLALCSAMILLGRGLGLRIVCEGVETARELEALRMLGCEQAQGYHFDRPLPIDRLASRWLREGAGERAASG